MARPITRWALVLIATGLVAGAWLWSRPQTNAPSKQIAVPGSSSAIGTPSPTATVPPAAAAKTTVVNRPFVAPTGPLKKHLDELARQAQAGDNTIAYFLATQLFECRQVTPDQRVTVSDSEGLPGLSADCRGLSVEDVEQFRHWAQLAADRGSAEAQVGYGLLVGEGLSMNDALRNPRLLDDYKQRTLDYLQRAARSGFAPAFRALSNVYEQGVLVPQDLTRAYAYRLAYETDTDQTASTTAQALASQLTEAQRQRAQVMAQQIADASRGPRK